MVRPNDEFWSYVEKVGGSFKCKFCGFVFSAETSISRFKLHLSGVEGRGVNICREVLPEVKKRAYEATQNPNKRRKTMPSSSNNEARNTGPTSSREQTNEVEIGVRGGGMVQADFSIIEQEMGEGRRLQGGRRRQDWAEAGEELRNIVSTSSQDQTNEVETGVRGGGMVQTEVQTAEQETGAVRSPFDAEFTNVFQTLCLERLDVIHKTLDAPNIQDENEVRDARMAGTEVQSTEQEMVEWREQEESREMPQEYFMQLNETGVPGGSGNEVTYTVPTSSQEQPNEGEIEVRDVGMAPAEARSMEQEMGKGGEQENWNESMTDDSMRPIERGSSPKGPVVDAQENIIANVQQTTDGDLVGQGVSKPWDGIISFLMEDQTLSNERDNVGVSLPTKELVGHAFEEKKKEIWSRLMKDDVLSIGVWGMGGVGKTTLMRHIHRLLERPNIFAHVYWVTVSQDFSIYKLQNLIARAIKFDLSKEDDVWVRAMKLHDELIEKQKFVLILDDLWNQFDVEEVGIPVRVNQCKLILTTRSRKICRQMHVNEENVIKVEPLSWKEAWYLFQKELGNYDTKLEPLAKAVASECAGLPLGLKTMARSMRGVDDVSEWRNALEELKEAEKREDDMEPEVFRILRYSYNRLNDSMLQECFLYCALFPEDFMIKGDDLIEYWIVEGIIMGKKSRLAEHDKGHDILNKLENVCLLEGWKDEGDRCVKMHDLIRDMAIQKLREKSVMVEAGRHLEELPEVVKWTEDLVRVSLIKNDILEIPSSHSPRCPKLSTLLLRSNWKLSFIADSFFQQLHGLTVLDLSYTEIDKLPNSISELVSLIALLLKECKNLTHIPSLAKLKALKQLDLRFTECLEEVPGGMELLSNLRYLNLEGSGVKEFPTGMLPNFSHLQVLLLSRFYNVFERKIISVKGKEVACLKKLEIVVCCFEHLFDFKEYIELRKETLLLYTYSFVVGQLHADDIPNDYIPYELSKNVWLCGCSINSHQDFAAFPEDIGELMILRCNVPRTFFVDFSLRFSTKLKYIYLFQCNGIKSLLSMSSSSPTILKSLETLFLSNLMDFRNIISKEEAALQPLPPNATFSSLRHFEMEFCDRVKRLFSFSLLSNLQNLEIIIVGYCVKMEEILVAKEEEDDDNNDDENEEEEEGNMGEKNNSSNDNLPVQFSFPKLWRLVLRALPKLKSICKGVMICDSLQQIELVDCPKLKRIPLSFPLPFLGRIQAYPAKWWESVEWSHIREKNLLQRKVVFSEH